MKYLIAAWTTGNLGFVFWQGKVMFMYYVFGSGTHPSFLSKEYRVLLLGI
jgi:hypothetical protein